jgi:hypothetical protein
MKKHLTKLAKIPANLAKLPVRIKAEIIAQTALYLFIAPRAFDFFYGTASIPAGSLQQMLIGLAFVLMFAGTYLLAVVLMGDTTSRERWALFFLSFVLVPVPLAIAYRFSKRLGNVYASMIGSVAAYFVAQVAVSYLFRVYIYLIDRIVS